MYNEEENKPLFGNENYNVPDNMPANNVDDMPPELGEIKPLSNINNLSAPTKNVLETPTSFFEQSYQNDKLDYYENNISSVNNTNFESQNNIQNTSYDNNLGNLESTYTPPSSDILGSYESPSNVQEESTASLVNNNETNSNLDSNSLASSEDKNSSESNLEDQNNQKSYEIINNLTLTDDSTLENVDPLFEEDTLSIDDPEEQINENENNEYIDEIKKIVEKMNSNGIKARTEEFDFETIHQIIVVIEK